MVWPRVIPLSGAHCNKCVDVVVGAASASILSQNLEMQVFFYRGRKVMRDMTDRDQEKERVRMIKRDRQTERESVRETVRKIETERE